MNRASINVLGSGLLSLRWLTSPAWAAKAETQELDEVRVNGVRIKPTRDPQKIVNWLKLLVGQLRYSGYVDLNAEGVPRQMLPVQGAADFGSAYLVNGTLTTTTPCPNLGGVCNRIARITPAVDGKRVEMQIDIEREYRRVVRYRFVLQRVGEVPEGAISGSEP